MTLARSPSVVFGEGRRPETAALVTLPAFDGPLGLLLALIEARQLDVLTVPLGALADAYLDALATLDGDRMGNVSAFVAVASQLILIKSQAMLPRHRDEAATPLAKDELSGPRGAGYRRMIEGSVAKRAGTADEVGAVGALLMGPDGGFITGSDFLMDGGVTAAYWYGDVAEVRGQ